MIEVPVICPPGQQLDPNGRCRPIWRKHLQQVMIKHFLECVKAENADINKCRDQLLEERDLSFKNIIEVPVVCPPGQRPDKNGICRIVQSRMPYGTFV